MEAGFDPKFSMPLKVYHHPILGHQFAERFGIRSYLQEHLLKQPIVPEKILKDVVREGELLRPDTEVEVPSIEFEKPAVTGVELEFKAELSERSVYDPPDCEPPEDLPDVGSPA